jgi:hypothetical protein
MPVLIRKGGKPPLLVVSAMYSRMKGKRSWGKTSFM